MHTTVKLILRTSKVRKDGTSPVYLRITANRKSRFVSTKVYVEPKYWNERKEQVRATHELAATFNHALKTFKTDAIKEALASKTATEVKKAIKGTGGSLSKYFQGFIDDLDQAGRFWDWKKYRVTFRKLTDVLGTSIDWAELDRDALVRLERYMREQEGNKPNTIRKEMQRVRRVIRAAIKEGIITAQDDPFLFYERPAAQRPERRKLTMHEIEALEAVALPAGTWPDISRDVFIFAFYAAGMRFGDVCRLKPENITERDSDHVRIRYTMAKTGNPTSIPAPRRILRIIEKYEVGPTEYVFPMLRGRDVSNPVTIRKHISSANVMVNKFLKSAAKQAGISSEDLSMHIARHSWADYARRQSGDLYAISKSLGHRSLETTEMYLKSLDEQAQDDLATTLWT